MLAVAGELHLRPLVERAPEDYLYLPVLAVLAVRIQVATAPTAQRRVAVAAVQFKAAHLALARLVK